jgi:hypothetical protein
MTVGGVAGIALRFVIDKSRQPCLVTQDQRELASIKADTNRVRRIERCGQRQQQRQQLNLAAEQRQQAEPSGDLGPRLHGLPLVRECHTNASPLVPVRQDFLTELIPGSLKVHVVVTLTQEKLERR